VLTQAMNAFRGTLGVTVVQCRPADPEAKGLVERANGYLETSFLPGRSFTSPADFTTQLTGWPIRADTCQRPHPAVPERCHLRKAAVTCGDAGWHDRRRGGARWVSCSSGGCWAWPVSVSGRM
jgi:hypothetical protein